MDARYALPLILAAAVSACRDETGPTEPLPPPPAPAVLLRDIVIPNLPSPYYHFGYDDAGRLTTASFASDLRVYQVAYEGDRISELKNQAVLDGDRLEYSYDDAGRVSSVDYVDANGVVFTRVFYSYDGRQLTGIERQRKVAAGFSTDKLTALSYYPDGNLLEIRQHHPALDGQQETTTIDRFEQYDDMINVDAFGLIHDEFFDHLVLLPGVRLQVGNPAREIRTGDGTNYVIHYSYSYDDRGRPLSKHGELTFTNGADAGRTFQVSSAFSYY